MSPRLSHSVRVVLVLGALLAIQLAIAGRTGPAIQPPSSTAASTAPDPRLDWWREARFGLFIHWGLYAVPAGEWNGRTDYGEWIRHSARIPLDVYDRFRDRFNPTKFDPEGWVRLAKQAGMKYIVITTKHHDGFALFDSKVSEFDVMATPFRRDVMKALAEAAAKEGIRICWYYSIMDWHHPDYLPRRDWEATIRPAIGADLDQYVPYMKAQLRELLTAYGPIGVLWFDGQWEGSWTNERGRDLYSYVRSLQPSIIVNNRVGRAGGDFGLNREQGLIGDFGTPEQEVPATGVPGLDWESCMTMNRNWGYNRADKNFKSSAELVRMLADVASKGGNLLLNVGPTEDGEFPPESVTRLREIGAWMDANGESIHGTQASPFPLLAWGRATERPLGAGATRLYLHVFDWPRDGVLEVPGLLNDPRTAHLLADRSKAPLAVTRREDALRISLPAGPPPDPIDTVVVLEVSGRPDVTVPPSIAAETPIFVDGIDVAITSNRARVEIRYTTDGSEPTSGSPVARGPVRLRQTATVKARAFRGSRAVSPTSEGTFTRVSPRRAEQAPDVAPGLLFDVVEGEFKELPDFVEASIVKSGSIAGIDPTPRTREAGWAIRLRGFIKVPSTGVYRFHVRSDDGSRLWIGDQLIVDNDGLHSSREATGVVALGAGLHRVTVSMFELSGGFELGVGWSGPGIATQPVPASAWFRPADKRRAQASDGFGAGPATRFADLALACIHKEYPNKIAHVLSSDADVKPPRELTPAFYGCYDWHSSVHGHWLLVRLARTFPDAPFTKAARQAVAESLTPEHVAVEVAYMNGAGRTSFERPYGLAWLLQLAAELREWNDPQARTLASTVRPLEEAATRRLKDWLPKLARPIRIGEHDQTAFAFGLILDWARTSHDTATSDLLTKRIEEFYLLDRNCPIAYEPSGQDFLSPCLAEADLMRRILPPARFADWLRAFLPGIPADGSARWIEPAIVTDPTDPKLAHLDGLNLSRAWMLDGIVFGLPPSDPRRPALQAMALKHRAAGLASVTGAHYEGGHWLGSFAVYLSSGRGLGSGDAKQP